MYGLILKNLQDYIIEQLGEESWNEIRLKSDIVESSFSIHQIYPDSYVNRITSIASEILEIEPNQFSENTGTSFVRFLKNYGYDQILSVLGRYFRDFLNGLDNLHEYMKFSYPRLRAPSFICENETKHGLILHYRSKRHTFIYYTIGIIKEVAKVFYNKELAVEVKEVELYFDVLHVSMQLIFNNDEFKSSLSPVKSYKEQILISSTIFFEIFPFSIAFSNDMDVKFVGNSLAAIVPDMVGKKLTSSFNIVRPIIQPTFSKILTRVNNIFELITIKPVISQRTRDKKLLQISEKTIISGIGKLSLTLKGEMIYMEKWEMIVYLGTPVLPNLDHIIANGLYINDLSMHDFSRDLMLAGTQQSFELKLTLEQEQAKTKRIENSINKLDDEMERTNQLLYQMIPEKIAERLRAGESPVDTCQRFESVSILFSDIVQFTEICTRLSPMEVVSMLNAMYSIFDNLTEKHGVQKVETIGDAYMVFSGEQNEEKNHVCRVCDMALDMMHFIQELKDPSSDAHLKLRIGVHTGPVVAGIVGLKMPRYCLFGKSVNTAAQMESSSQPMKIQITQSTYSLLPLNYQTQFKGEMRLSDNCVIKTYWLESKSSENCSERLIDNSLPSINNCLYIDDPDIATHSEISIENTSSGGENLDQISYDNRSSKCQSLEEKIEPIYEEAGCCCFTCKTRKCHAQCAVL